MYFFDKLIKKEKISSLIKRYRDQLSEYQDDPFLSRIDLNIIEEIENSKESKIKKELEKLRNYIKKPFKLSFEENKLNLFSTYNEIHNIWFLIHKGLNVEKIKERKGMQTPDYCIHIDNSKFYLELKTETFVNHVKNYSKMVENSFNAKIDAEEQRKNGYSIIMTSYSTNPYDSEYGTYNYETATLLIEKINNQLKFGQIECDKSRKNTNSFLLIDLRLLGPICTEDCFLKPVFSEIDNRTKENFFLSNQLWITCLGKKNEKLKLLKDSYYDSRPNSEPLWEEKTLQVNGILRDYSELQGLIFQTEYLCNSSFKYIGYSIHNNARTKMFMKQLCDSYIIYDIHHEKVVEIV